MDPGWYYSKLDGPPGQQSGPVSWEQLVSYARSGFLVPEDLVRSEGSTTWHPAAEIPGLLTAPPVAAHQPPAPSPSEPAGHRRSRLLLWLLPLIAVLLVGAGLGAYFGFRYQEDHHDLEALAFTQQEGEIFLEAAGVAGPGSFTEERFVSATPSTSLSIPSPALTLPPVTSTTNPATSTPTVASGAVVLASYAGDTPALYGGSKSKVIADKESELLFLEQNPLKAAAFCEALNSDPTLRWSGGTQVRPDQLRDYFAELTPLLLTRDTRVTNYGYRDGHPTPRQSVLQAGQMVLVDRYGVPRKRCECGNPLTPPLASRRPPVYTGPKWTGFNPGTIIIIQQTTVIINDFTVIDINTGQPFGRPAGTAGASDGKPPGGSAGQTSGTGPAEVNTTASMGMNWGTGEIPSTTQTTASMGMNWGTGEIPSSQTTATVTPTSLATTAPTANPIQQAPPTTEDAGRFDINTYVVAKNNVDRMEGNKLEMWHRDDMVELRGPITIEVYHWHLDIPFEKTETVTIVEGETYSVYLDEYSGTHPGDCNITVTLLTVDERSVEPSVDPTP